MGGKALERAEYCSDRLFVANSLDQLTCIARTMGAKNRLNASEVDQVVEELFIHESRKIYSTLVRLLNNWDLAEESMNEAFAAAVIQWKESGIPANPFSWLVSTAKFKAIDFIRSQSQVSKHSEAITDRIQRISNQNLEKREREIEDDRLRLIFACCHPSIDPSVQIALTLREVCGLSTDEIAKAFLISTTSMAQRIVRGKNKIRLAGIPFEIPSSDVIAERLESVLTVIYLVYSEGYAASHGEMHLKRHLTEEAIRLGRLVLQYIPDSEGMGLLALMLFQESRCDARVDENGDIVTLEDQDRSRWNAEFIAEGFRWLNLAVQSRSLGPMQLQALIASCHAKAETYEATNWEQIAKLYGWLDDYQPSPVVKLNRAVALAMLNGPETGLEHIDRLLKLPDLQKYHLIYAAKADLHRRNQDWDEAIVAYKKSLELVTQSAEKRFLERRLADITRLVSENIPR